MTAEQIEPIRRALEEEYDLTAATQRYREAAPQASLAEAKQYVLHLFLSLRRQHPEKFAPPPLSLATMNWKGIGICVAIEAIALIELWFRYATPSHSLSTVSQFAYSFLLGMGLIAGLRVKGYWKRLLLLIPALVVMIVSETIVHRLAEASSHSPGPCLCGFFFGMVLMMSGLRSLRSLRRKGLRQPPNEL